MFDIRLKTPADILRVKNVGTDYTRRLPGRLLDAYFRGRMRELLRELFGELDITSVTLPETGTILQIPASAGVAQNPKEADHTESGPKYRYVLRASNKTSIHALIVRAIFCRQPSEDCVLLPYDSMYYPAMLFSFDGATGEVTARWARSIYSGGKKKGPKYDAKVFAVSFDDWNIASLRSNLAPSRVSTIGFQSATWLTQGFLRSVNYFGTYNSL